MANGRISRLLIFYALYGSPHRHHPRVSTPLRIGGARLIWGDAYSHQPQTGHDMLEACSSTPGMASIIARSSSSSAKSRPRCRCTGCVARPQLMTTSLRPPRLCERSAANGLSACASPIRTTAFNLVLEARPAAASGARPRVAFLHRGCLSISTWRSTQRLALAAPSRSLAVASSKQLAMNCPDWSDTATLA